MDRTTPAEESLSSKTSGINPKQWRALAPPLGLLAALVLASSVSARTSYTGYPNSIAVLGHSGATGYDSDPKQPGTDINANSWATGTNPAVNSVYRRILARNPRIKGHNLNLAQDGGTVRELLGQAQEVVRLKAKPEVILIQIMDNDIVCPAKKSDLEAFRRGVAAAVQVLVHGAPASSMFLVSQFGSPTTQAKLFTRDERLGQTGDGPCDIFAPSGRIAPKPLARLESTIHGYEAQLAAACKAFSKCRYDGGAFGRVVDRRAYLSSDLNHFSIRGHAKAAAVAWRALKRANLIPH